MEKQQQLDLLAQEIISSNICPELREGATQLIMGAGCVDATIVVIGEAPGKREDEQGVPFVGASGKFLDEMLSHAQLKRSDIYITNIVKYRPPHNRDPLPAEKQAFWPYLARQLSIIKPKVIITLGRHSMEYFIPGAKISTQHGIAVDVAVEDQTYSVIPLYHPAAALYNGSMRQVLIDDFIAAAKIAESTTLR